MRRRKEWERVAQRNVVRIHIIAGRERAVGNDVEQNVDRIIPQPTAIGKAGCRIVPAAWPTVWD